MAAQQVLLAGLPQVQNAILGRPVRQEGLQAQTVQFDPSFLHQQLPQFTGSQQALTPSSQATQLSPELLAALSGAVQLT